MTTLQIRNVLVDRHRTSMWLEPEMWEALKDIAQREGVSVNQLCTRVDAVRRQSSLTSGMRVFVLAYFRCAAEHARVDGGLVDQALDRATQLIGV
jgi:predicted DNA-binding ribbon-helix-helix protein